MWSTFGMEEKQCASCGKSVAPDRLLWSDNGEICPDCSEAAETAAKGRSLPPLLLIGLVAGAAPLAITITTTESTVVNGIAEVIYRDYVAIIGGILALICALQPARLALKKELAGGTNLAILAAVIALGVFQLARGFGLLHAAPSQSTGPTLTSFSEVDMTVLPPDESSEASELSAAERLERLTPACKASDVAACRTLCEQDELWACYKLASVLIKPGVAQDPVSAMQLYDRCCAQGFLDSCNEVGYAHDKGIGRPADPAKAVTFYRKACEEQDVALACSNMAVMHRDGIGVPKDLALTFAYRKKACALKNAKSCADLGVMLFHGDGVEKNEAEAVSYYKTGCDGNVGGACFDLALSYELGLGVEKDPSEALSLYIKGCRLKNLEACGNLALMHYLGTATPMNKAEAFELWSSGCDQDHGLSCRNIGVMHRQGETVEKSASNAAPFFRKACELGDVNGCGALGQAYLNGQGVDRDIEKAKPLLQRGCDAKLSWACADLEKLKAAPANAPVP